MPRWEAVCLPGTRRRADRAGDRAGLLAGGALIPVVGEPLHLPHYCRHCPGVRKPQGRITFRRPLEKPQVFTEAQKFEQFEPEPVVEGTSAAAVSEVAAPPRDQELESPVAVANSASAPADLVASRLRRRVLQSGSRRTWPRVRLPVTTEAMRRFGDDWPEALARCIAKLRPEAPANPVEVVAVRPLKMELAEGREKVHCRAGGGALPAVGSLCCMQWYGDLSSMVEACLDCWVVELALEPPADCSDAKALAKRPLTSSTDPPRVVAVEGKVFPPRVDRLFNLREAIGVDVEVHVPKAGIRWWFSRAKSSRHASIASSTCARWYPDSCAASSLGLGAWSPWRPSFDRDRSCQAIGVDVEVHVPKAGIRRQILPGQALQALTQKSRRMTCACEAIGVDVEVHVPKAGIRGGSRGGQTHRWLAPAAPKEFVLHCLPLPCIAGQTLHRQRLGPSMDMCG
eukprot:s392_g17.t2